MATEASALRRPALRAPSARSLLFTVLGEYVLPAGGEVWAGPLVKALAALGVEEKAARQAMARTAADRWLERERVGREVRWRLSADARSLLGEGAERIYSFGNGASEWDGRWVVLVTTTPERSGGATTPERSGGANGPETSREVRHRLRTRLAWAGFGTLRNGVWISAHPDREHEARRVLGDLGIDATSFVGPLGEVGAPSDVVATAWDLGALEERYERLLDAFGRVRPSDPQTKFSSLTRLVHEWRKFPFLDPGLPTSLLPSRWSGKAAHDLFGDRYARWKPGADEWFSGLRR